MSDKFYECIVTTTRVVTVRVPVDDKEIVYPGEDPEEVAIEFATSFPNYWIDDQGEDVDVEAREVPAPDGFRQQKTKEE